MARAKPPTEKCPPCRGDCHGECEGPKVCNCMICNQIKPVVEDMQRDWELGDRAKTWPDG